MRKLGQHFLRNNSIAKKIASFLNIEEGDFLAEIGPGRGALTFCLLEEVQRKNGRLILIEKDLGLLGDLRKRLGNYPEIVLKGGDALREIPEVANSGKYKLVGNIPYYITGRLFRVLSTAEKKPERAVLMVQKEVGERISADPPKMNRLAAISQVWADIKIVASVSKENFIPPPEVESAVILMEKNEKIPFEGQGEYFDMVKGIFQQPRKTLVNNLAQAGFEKELILQALSRLNLPRETRPQNLSVEQIIRLSNILRN